jgi:DNA-binding GntR family transcriptional regulator
MHSHADIPMTPEQSLERARDIVRLTVSSEPEATSTVIGIAIDLGAEIIEERIPQGADLNSVELARRFGTSRTPVREALMLLEKQGLVDIPPRRRPRAGRIDVERAREIYQTRAILMEAVAPGVVASALETDFDLLGEKAKMMQQALLASDERAFFWANTDFHIVNVSLSRAFLHLMESGGFQFV